MTYISKTISITARGGSECAVLWVQNNQTDASDPTKEHYSEINLTADNITLTGENGTHGIVAMSHGKVNIEGNLTVTADNVILTRGDSIININASGKHDVVLNGDVNFNHDSKTSGTSINSTVNVVLNTPGSSWTGNTKVTWDNQKPNNPETLEVTDMTLDLSNGASWNVTEVEENDVDSNGAIYTSLNNLVLNNGIVNVEQNTSQSVAVDKLSGNGGTINVAAATADGETFDVANLEIASIEGTPALTVNATGINADDVVNAEAALAAVNDAVAANGTTKTNTIAEGDVQGALTQEVGADGNTGEIKEAANTKLSSLSSLTAFSVMTWRHDMNDLTKRMGELRMSPGKIGGWARIYGSEQEYGAQNVTNKSTSVQVGGDFSVTSDWKVGAAFTYTDGSGTYTNGTGDSESYGIAAYATWMPADSGLFVDGIVKYARLSNDFSFGNMKGSNDNNAFSASIETGWHFKLNDVAFVEPQVEVTYGSVIGDTFTASNNVTVDQDDFSSLIGRAGLRAGFYFPNNKGTIYARASVLHDFDGDMKTIASKADITPEVTSEDLGGTWYEMGIGANFNITDNTYVYVDLERNNAGKVVENWRWNVGLRTAF